MNLDHILKSLNRHKVNYLLIGGMNYLLRHQPVTTFDIDFWIEDSEANRIRCEKALAELKAEWGTSDKDWGPVASQSRGWLSHQRLFCLTSPYGAIDVFRAVKGLISWRQARARAVRSITGSGVAYHGLSDRDMLRSQLALDKSDRKPERIRQLKKALRGKT